MRKIALALVAFAAAGVTLFGAETASAGIRFAPDDGIRFVQADGIRF